MSNPNTLPNFCQTYETFVSILKENFQRAELNIDRKEQVIKVLKEVYD